MKRFFLSVLAVLSVCISSAQEKNYAALLPGDSEQEIIRKAANVVPAPRQLRWQQLELTAFFHFGINTFTNREWGTGSEDPKLFNPTQLDARQWVRVCREAGIKQVILTAKHHDGFCLWPSTFTDHSVISSPWKNGRGDVVKEVSAACKEYGMGFGIYLSPWDRHSPVYGTDAYNDYFVNQLTELLTGYGRVDEVWFDGANGEGPNGKKQVYDFDRWYRLIRQLQPSATIAIMGPDVRWVGTESGHGRATEWSVVPVDQLDPEVMAGHAQQDIAFSPKGDMTGEDLGSREKIRKAKALVWYPAETDVSIRPGWFYHAAEDSLVKSPERLTEIYFHSVGRNGVLLLNIPPDRRGLISNADIKSLLGWKKMRDEIFRTNLLKGSRLTNKGKDPSVLFDGRDDSFLNPPSPDSGHIIELVLPRTATFNVLVLQENIRKGQRVEKFVLECRSHGAWKTVCSGTTIGYKRIIQFDRVSVDRVRLRILSSRLTPAIAEFGLYLRK